MMQMLMRNKLSAKFQGQVYYLLNNVKFWRALCRLWRRHTCLLLIYG